MQRVCAVTLSVMVCAGLLLTACQPTTSQPDEGQSSGTSSQQATPKPAKFSVSELSVSPREVTPGQEVSVSVKVTNTGDLKGKYIVELGVNGVRGKFKAVLLEGGESTTVTFVLSKEAAGEYSVEIDEVSGSFTVE